MLETDLHEHRLYPPEKGSKSRVIQEYTEKEAYLQFEVTSTAPIHVWVRVCVEWQRRRGVQGSPGTPEARGSMFSVLKFGATWCYNQSSPQSQIADSGVCPSAKILVRPLQCYPDSDRVFHFNSWFIV